MYLRDKRQVQTENPLQCIKGKTLQGVASPPHPCICYSQLMRFNPRLALIDHFDLFFSLVRTETACFMYLLADNMRGFLCECKTSFNRLASDLIEKVKV